MRLTLLVVGKTAERWIAVGVKEYLGRLGHYCPVREVVVKEKKGRMRDRDRIEAEGTAILERLGQGLVVALDPGGRQMSSEGLAAWLTDLRDRGTREVFFVIGGPLGLSARVLARADMVLSLSAMTLTHDLARLLVAEQLYRAFSIIAGSKYHK